MAAPSRVTVSPAGSAVVALCHVGASGAPVLVVDDGSVSLRVDVSALSGAAAVALAESLGRAVADLGRLVRRWADDGDGGGAVPPPPYAGGGG